LLRGDVGAVIKAQRQAVKQTVHRGLRADTPQFGMTLMPVVDGDFLPQRPIDAIAAGAAKDIDLLASVTRDEWNLFVHQPQFSGGRNEKAEQLDEARLLHIFERALPGRGASMLAFYRGVSDRKRNGNLADLLCWMETDRMFHVPTQRMLAAQAQHQANVYAAQFNWENPNAGGVLGACHVVDVPFVFGVTGTPVGQYFTGGGAQAEALSLQVMAAWAAFARCGAPAGIDGVAWPAYGAQRQAMGIGPAAALTVMPASAVLEHWSFMA
jgi:para-nitrobenzyl esterase